MVVNNNHSDGFLGRFLVATPKEEYITLKEKIDSIEENVDNNAGEIVISIQDVFNKIYEKFFAEGTIFKLDRGAMDLFEVYHDNDVLKTRMREQFEEVKCTILSKSIGHVLRLAGIQSAIRICLDEMNGTQEIGNDNENEFEGCSKYNWINEDDMKRAIVLVKYSMQCLFSIIDASKDIVTKPGKKRDISNVMPSANAMDEEFLMLHKCKIQKLFTMPDDNDNNIMASEIKVSKITKNHMVPQIGGKSCSADVKKFLKGLENHGLGELIENTQNSFFRVANKENVSENVLNFMDKLGILN